MALVMCCMCFILSLYRPSASRGAIIAPGISGFGFAIGPRFGKVVERTAKKKTGNDLTPLRFSRKTLHR